MANMDVKHQSWSYFGLPYQDHNYGAPPPRTPPISPGRSGSSAAAVGCVVLDKMVPDISQVKREEIIVESDLLDSSSSFPVVGSTVNIESTSAAESLPAHGHNSSAPTNHSAHSPPANPRQRHRTSSGSALSIAPASGTASKKARVSSGHRNSVKNNSTLSSTGYSSSASSSLQRASARSSLDKHPSKRHPETRASEGSYDNSVTRCVCDLQHDDGYMICCDHCMVWQHIDCMGVDRDRIPENYFCERCDPRPVDKQRAVELQKRKVAEMSSSSDGSSSDDDAETANANGKKRLSVQQRTRKGDKLHRKKNGIKRAIHKQSKQKEQLPPKRRLSSTMKNSRAKGKDVEEEVDEVDANDMCENGSLSSEYEYIKENIYSPEVLRLTSKLNGQHTIDFHILRQIQPRSHLIEVDTERRSLIARENMEPHQLIAEYRGEILVAEDFDDLDIDDSLIYRYCNYKGTEIFIDTRTYGNESRYIQRSTTPNGEVQHFVDNGKIFFLIYSTRFIGKGEEITLAFNHANCCDEPSKKALGADSPIEERPSQNCAGSVDVDDQSPNEISSPGLDSQDKPKQLSREERKIEAIMKMFERLEKEQQRKQTTDKRRGRSDSGEEKPLSPENLPEQHSLTQSRTLVNRRVSTNSRGRRGRHSSSSRRQGRTRSNSIISNSGSEVTTRSDSSVDVEMPSGTVLHGRELTSTPIADGTGFKLPKTKKHLMNEWLSNEGVATPPSPDKVVDRPLTVRTADEENFVHFVRYSSSPKFSGLDLLRRATQPSPLSPHVVTPTAGGAADSSSAAKKRWLRQAMHSEVASERETPSVSNETSPSPSPVDYVTPLKKRRLARESVDISSTVSMSTESSCEEVPGDKPEMVCSGQLPHEELFAMELTANPSYPECASSAVDSNTPDRDLPASVSEVSNSISQPLLSVCERLLPACLGRSGEPSATVEMVSESVGATSTSNGAAERSATVDQILPDASADDEFDRSTVNAALPPPVDSAYISESDSALVAQSGGDTTPLMDEGVVTSAVADGEEVCGGECDSSSRGIDYVPVESYCLELSPDDQDERETEPTSSMVEAADSCGEPGPCSSSTDVCSQPSHDTRFHPKKKLMSLADWPSSGDAEMVTSSSGEAAAAASESRHSPLAATKKKMSLEEYRRRVRDRPSTDEPADSTRPSKSTDADNASLPSLEDLPPPPPPPPPEGASPDVKKKWAAFPGMERKYESLAERLRREFSVDIDEEAEREKKALAAQLPFGGILSMSVPGSIPVPLAQPIMFMGNHHLPLDHHSPSSQALPYSPREVHSTTPPSGPATSRFSRQSSADASGMPPSYSNGPNGSHQYRYSPYSQSKEVQPSRPHSYQSKPNSVGPFRRNSHKW